MRTLYAVVACCIWVFAMQAQGPVCNSNFTIKPKKGHNTTFAPPSGPTTPSGPSGGPPPTGERLIMFLHGLSGNAESWLDVANATQTQIGASSQIDDYPARKAICKRPLYSENNMDAAALAVQDRLLEIDDLNGLIDDMERTFIVAHSQGGLVARNLDLAYATPELSDITADQRRFYGLVTFGTPHQGSLILDNLGQFVQMSENACFGIAAGPIAEGIEGVLAFDFFEQLMNFEAIRDKMCSMLGEEDDPFTLQQEGVVNMFLDQLPLTSLEFNTGSVFLTEINNPVQGQVSVLPTARKVAFYGIEEQPVLWRELYNLQVKLPNDFEPFGAADDSPLVIRTNELHVFAAAKLDAWQSEVEDWAWQTPLLCISGVIGQLVTIGPATLIPCAFALTQQQDAVETRNAWQTTVDWWETANDQYRAIIGELQQDATTVVQACQCEQYINSELVNTWPQEQGSGCTAYAGNQSDYTICQSGYSMEIAFVTHLSDGLVPIESQVGYPGATTEPDPYGNPASKYLMNKSNHQQMRNDPNTKVMMLRLFNSEFGNWFFTETDN